MNTGFRMKERNILLAYEAGFIRVTRVKPMEDEAQVMYYSLREIKYVTVDKETLEVKLIFTAKGACKVKESLPEVLESMAKAASHV